MPQAISTNIQIELNIRGSNVRCQLSPPIRVWGYALGRSKRPCGGYGGMRHEVAQVPIIPYPPLNKILAQYEADLADSSSTIRCVHAAERSATALWRVGTAHMVQLEAPTWAFGPGLLHSDAMMRGSRTLGLGTNDSYLGIQVALGGAELAGDMP